MSREKKARTIFIDEEEYSLKDLVEITALSYANELAKMELSVEKLDKLREQLDTLTYALDVIQG